MKSNTKIEFQLKKKTNPNIVQTVILAKKNKAWAEIASILTGSRRNRKEFNLSDVEKAGEGTIVVCGKLLSQGEVTGNKKVAALNFSEKAREKLVKAGCQVELLSEEIQNNKDAKDVKILK